jgi:hypothetical protein
MFILSLQGEDQEPPICLFFSQSPITTSEVKSLISASFGGSTKKIKLIPKIKQISLSESPRSDIKYRFTESHLLTFAVRGGTEERFTLGFPTAMTFRQVKLFLQNHFFFGSFPDFEFGFKSRFKANRYHMTLKKFAERKDLDKNLIYIYYPPPVPEVRVTLFWRSKTGGKVHQFRDRALLFGTGTVGSVCEAIRSGLVRAFDKNGRSVDPSTLLSVFDAQDLYFEISSNRVYYRFQDKDKQKCGEVLLPLDVSPNGFREAARSQSGLPDRYELFHNNERIDPHANLALLATSPQNYLFLFRYVDILVQLSNRRTATVRFYENDDTGAIIRRLSEQLHEEVAELKTSKSKSENWVLVDDGRKVWDRREWSWMAVLSTDTRPIITGQRVLRCPVETTKTLQSIREQLYTSFNDVFEGCYMGDLEFVNERGSLSEDTDTSTISGPIWCVIRNRTFEYRVRFPDGSIEQHRLPEKATVDDLLAAIQAKVARPRFNVTFKGAGVKTGTFLAPLFFGETDAILSVEFVFCEFKLSVNKLVFKMLAPTTVKTSELDQLIQDRFPIAESDRILLFGKPLDSSPKPLPAGWNQKKLKISTPVTEQRLNFLVDGSIQRLSLKPEAAVNDVLNEIGSRGRATFSQGGLPILQEPHSLLASTPLSHEPIIVTTTFGAVAGPAPAHVPMPVTFTSPETREQKTLDLFSDTPSDVLLSEAKTAFGLNDSHAVYQLFTQDRRQLDPSLCLGSLPQPRILHVVCCLCVTVSAWNSRTRDPLVEQQYCLTKGSQVSHLQAMMQRQFPNSEIALSNGSVLDRNTPIASFSEEDRMALVAVPTVEVRMVVFDSDATLPVRVIPGLSVRTLKVILAEHSKRSVGDLSVWWDGTEHRDDESIDGARGDIRCATYINPAADPAVPIRQAQRVPRQRAKKPADYYNRLNELETQSRQPRLNCIRCYNYHEYRFEDALAELQRQ